MKKIVVLLFGLAPVCFQSTAFAESDLYYGGKFGLMLFDPEGYEDPINAGAVVGYRLWRNLSIEGEVTTSISDGKTKVLLTGFDVSVQTLAAFAAYRSPGETFFKAKAGFVNADVEVGTTSNDDTDTAFGLGYGWKTSSDLSFEVEYTVISNDVNFLSFALIF